MEKINPLPNVDRGLENNNESIKNINVVSESVKNNNILKLAEQGYRFFPCLESKAPATMHGFYDSVSDVEKLKIMFRDNRYYIGFPTGRINKNIVVLDIDINKDGDTRTPDQLLDELEEILNEKIDRTGFQVQTKNRGLHLYFQAPKDVKIQGGVRFFDKTLSIDLQSDGKYVIFPDDKNYIVYDSDIEIDEFYNHLPPLPESIINFKKQQNYEDISAPGNILPPGEVREIRSALSFLDADERQIWIDVGMALKNTGCETAFGLWDEWSKTSDKYKAEDQPKRWKGLKPKGDLTIASVFHWAKERGWVTTYEKEINYSPINIEKELEMIEEECNKFQFTIDSLSAQLKSGDIITDYFVKQITGSLNALYSKLETEDTQYSSVKDFLLEKKYFDANRDPDILLGYYLSEFPSLALKLDGVQAGFIIFAGPSHIGKTSWLTNSSISLLRANSEITLIYISLDDHRGLITNRFLSIISGLPINQVQRKQEGENKIKLDEAYNELVKYANDERLVLYDSSEINEIISLKKYIQNLIINKNKKLVLVIDGLYNLDVGNFKGIREENVQRAKELKLIVDQYKIPVIATAETIKKGTDDKLSMSDIMESGKYIYNASLILLIEPQDYKLFNDPNSKIAITELTVAKNKLSDFKGVLEFTFNKTTTKITEETPAMNFSKKGSDIEQENEIEISKKIQAELKGNKLWQGVKK